jgi:bifunctional non-homologous end joining protein LigD
VYSLRAKRDAPFVSMPLRWEEVEATARSGHADALLFSPQTAIERVQKIGDLFEPVLTLEQTIPRELLRELGFAASIPAPQPVKLVVASAPARVPRSSGQGGRQLFVIHRRTKEVELAIEVNGEFRTFLLSSLPVKKKQAVRATSGDPARLSYLTEESGAVGIVWDLGTYEIVEGSYAKGDLLMYLSGRKLQGEWSLRRLESGRWECMNRGGRRIDRSDASALAGLLPAAPAGRRTRRAS